jgi:hypothetical protein
MNQVKKLYRNVYYSTILKIVEDLITQVKDLEECVRKKQYCYGEKEDKKMIIELLKLMKPGVEYYFGEGGIPLPKHPLEKFIRSHFSDVKFLEKFS